MPNEQTYIDLAKISVETHRIRQGLEWKMFFGLWGAMALLPWFVIEGHCRCPAA